VKIEIIGLYAVPESEEPCHLVEWRLSNYDGPFEIGGLMQPVPGEPRENWQAPWDEYLLGVDGKSGELTSSPITVTGETCFCFFYFYLDPQQPFQTPAGPVTLPKVTKRPARLSFVEFEQP